MSPFAQCNKLSFCTAQCGESLVCSSPADWKPSPRHQGPRNRFCSGWRVRRITEHHQLRRISTFHDEPCIPSGVVVGQDLLGNLYRPLRPPGREPRHHHSRIARIRSGPLGRPKDFPAPLLGFLDHRRRSVGIDRNLLCSPLLQERHLAEGSDFSTTQKFIKITSLGNLHFPVLFN